MDSKFPTQVLPPEIVQRASRSGQEYAWPIKDIPQVIEAARSSNLVNIGGQLQFLLPDGSVCECYWVQVDTYKSVDKALPWSERVTLTANAAGRDFQALRENFDFVAEGRLGFGTHLDAIVAQGLKPEEFMWFVWYLKSQE
jgi:hypothetical protein